MRLIGKTDVLTSGEIIKEIKMSTIILKCKCYHEYQDKIYGKQRRVHNIKKGGEKATCTVCGNERYIKQLS